MAPRIAPPSRNAAAQALLELYQSTERRIIQEIARKRMQGYVDYAELAALRRVRKTIQQMVDKSAKYVPLAIEHEFYKGKEARKGYENAAGLAEGSAERDRVAEQLVDNLMGEVQEMAQTAYQSAEAQVLGRVDPGVYRQSVLRGVIVSETMGRGSLSTVEEVMRNLQQAGITAFVDKAGREWSLSAYGSMAVRTTVRQAQVSAVLTADDHDLWKIKEIGSTCPLCAVYEGRVYSKSGMNPNYPPLAAAFGKMDPAGPNDLSNTFLNIHPNCLHSLVKWTEDYKTDEEIRQTREFSSFETNPKTNDPRTEKQIEAYRQKERQRAAYRREDNKKRKEEIERAKSYTRARNIKSYEDLEKVSSSSVIAMQNHKEICEYFEKQHGVQVQGFDKKELLETKAVLAGYDDMLSEFPEIKGRIKIIQYNPRIKDYGIINVKTGLSQVGPRGLKDYGTGVHECAHALDFYRSPYFGPAYSDQIVLLAKKNLKLKKREFEDLVTRITGTGDKKENQKLFEVFAYAIETAKGGVDNKLASEIYRLTKGGTL